MISGVTSGPPALGTDVPGGSAGGYGLLVQCHELGIVFKSRISLSHNCAIGTKSHQPKQKTTAASSKQIMSSTLQHGPVNQVLLLAVGLEAEKRPVDAGYPARTVVPQTVEPRRLPLEVSGVDAKPVVTQMRGDPGCCLLVPVTRSLIAFLLHESMLCRKRWWVSIRHELLVAHQGDVIWGKPTGRFLAYLQQSSLMNFVKRWPRSVGEPNNLLAAGACSLDHRDLGDEILARRLQSGIGRKWIEPCEPRCTSDVGSSSSLLLNLCIGHLSRPTGIGIDCCKWYARI